MAGEHRFSSTEFIQSGSVARFESGLEITQSVRISGPITASGNITASGPITAEGGGISPGAPGIAEGTSNFKATSDAETIEAGR